MKKIDVSVLLFCLIYTSFIQAQDWKNECVGYYQMQLPDNLEVALYPVDLIVNPLKDPGWRKDEASSRYLFPRISFGDNRDQDNNDRVQSQFSQFYYRDYKINISSESTVPIDFQRHENEFRARTDFDIQAYWDRRAYLISLSLRVLPKEQAEQFVEYRIDNFPDAFLFSKFSGYSAVINKSNRLYIFNLINRTYTLDDQLKTSRPEAIALLKQFQPRNLYEVPKEQGFCLPYGFIAGDSGHEKRDMAVTYRLKDHPDVTIFFQDLGMEPTTGTDKEMNAKEYVTWLWNWQYQWSSVSKKLLWPKWRVIEMDGRNGLGTFVKSVFKDGRTDYGYVAYVHGDHNSRQLNPDLLLYVMQNSEQAKGHPPMDKDELEKMAEHIISTVKHR